MRLHLQIIIIFIGLFSLTLYADDTLIRRPHDFKFRVVAWETITYPVASKKLRLHRHEHDRIIIALSDGRLKVVRNKGKPYFITLKKNQMYYLKRNVAGELHAHRNVSGHPIKILVMEIF